jgi:sarcosine oxidase
VNQNEYDTIVVGVGGMGSAAAYQLSRRGQRVLGLERFEIPHTFGSSHGVNRIIRKAYFEDPAYVPLLQRAYRLWTDLEEDSSERLLVITGGIDAAPERHPVFQSSLDSCRRHGLAHEVLTGNEVNRRFPGYSLPESHMAVYQPDGGYVMSEKAIIAHAGGAIDRGADIHTSEKVIEWASAADQVEVRTDKGSYRARSLIFTAGAWSTGLLDGLAGMAVPERQVLAWFEPFEPDLYDPAVFPIFNLEVDEGHLYGFPIETIPGFKIGLYHHRREVVDPDTMDREPNTEDEAVLRQVTERYFPRAAGNTLDLKTCLFTNSPDEHFIIDFLPGHSNVVVAAGFSGHGYKFASVVGEILADLAMEGGTNHEIGFLGVDRLGP